MRIRVRYLAVLKGLTEQPEKTVTLEGASLSDLIEMLRQKEDGPLKSRFFTSSGEVRPDLLIFINGVDHSLLGGRSAELKDEDEVTFLPSVHGG
ncbi:MAG TPA: MoaD family protein [Candidatus Methanomethylicus sp.]|nr:MoaD family protein [Candidatus Methanomethylicus sp.]HRR54389.1 MoaD family protein [Candidatus Methanomethylicus sp.]